MEADPTRLGRYTLHAEIASGGMAAVYVARASGDAGFQRIVAIKRLHPHLAREEGIVSMFLDEAHLAARIRHPNVVQTLDVVASSGELFLVMEYVDGETLSSLLRGAKQAGDPRPPVPIVSAILSGALHGLHAAHVATDESGRPLSIVHRDVSPQNVMVGADGTARVLDFGVAKAAVRLQTTREGQLKGKMAYMAPEQLSGIATHKTDLYAAGVVLWEALAGERLFNAENEVQLLDRVARADIPKPSKLNPYVSPDLDDVVRRAVARDPAARFASAQEMAMALERAMRPSTAAEVAAWVASVAGPRLEARRRQLAEMESGVRPALHRSQFSAFGQLGGMPPRFEPELTSTAAQTVPEKHPPFGVRRRWPWWAVAAAISCGAGGGLAAFLLASSGGSPLAVPSVAIATAPPPVEAPAPTVTASAAPTAEAQSAPSASASASASTSSAPPSRPRAPAAAARSSAPGDDLRGLIDSRR